MADVIVKYAKLVKDTLQLIDVDNAIIEATQKGDQSLMQPLYVTRNGIIKQIHDLANYKS